MDQLLAGNWQVFESINDHARQNSLVDQFMIVSANDLIFLIPLLLLGWWLLFASWSPLRRLTSGLSPAERLLGLRTLLLVVVSAGLALVANMTIGHLLYEPRPFVSHPQADHLLISHPADASFPSDHVALAFAVIAMFLLYWAILVRRQAPSLLNKQQTVGALLDESGRAITSRYSVVGTFSLLLLGIGLLIGFARIFVGVHYPLDVLGGAGIGFVSAGCATLLGQRLAQPLDRALLAVARYRLA